MPKSNKKKNKNKTKNKNTPNVLKGELVSGIPSGNKSESSDSDSDSGTELLPFVSICTPTFNRRPFIENMFQCFRNQEYPKDRMEWIIIDDGTDPIEDLVASHPRVKYFKNILHFNYFYAVIQGVQIFPFWMTKLRFRVYMGPNCAIF